MRRLAIVLVCLAGAAQAEAAPRRRPATSGKAARRPPAAPKPPPVLPSDPKARKALGEASRAYRGGDFRRAFDLAVPLRGAKLRNRDYALYLAAQSAFLLGDKAHALVFFEALGKEAGSRFHDLAAWRRADCLWDLGRFALAAREYERLLGKDGGDDGIALFRLGEARAAAGKKDLAIAAWRRLVLERPAHVLAGRALEAMIAAGAPPLGARERLARAQNLTQDRGWTQALGELALIGDGEPEDVRALRDFWIGETLFKMRRQYARAGKLLLAVYDKLGPKIAPQALFHGARAFSRSDHDDDAIKWYGELVKKYPRTDWAEEAAFLAGWLEYNRGNFRAALPGLKASLERYPSSKWADDARWYLGYSHYLLGEYDEALAHLERLIRRPGALEGGKARYWKARTLLAKGKKDEALQEWRDLVGTYPFSWYALLARGRLKEHGIALGPFGDRSGEGGSPRLGELDPALARDPLIAKVDELIEAGMDVEAGFELRRGEGDLMRRHGSGRALPILFDRYRKAQNFNRPWQLAEAYGGRALDLAPRDGARAWWENHYPLAYKAYVDKYQDVGKNPPLYIYAIMWKESGFHPHDVSYADAIGLLQMIPPTTRRVAPEVGLEYTDDLLYDPERNIMVGAWYIGNLAQKFKYQIPLAAGSFNSGPRPIMKWLDRYGDRPMDELVELVAFSQTREYMKKVTDAYARYLYLYKGVDYEQPLAVDRAYLNDGPDY